MRNRACGSSLLEFLIASVIATLILEASVHLVILSVRLQQHQLHFQKWFQAHLALSALFTEYHPYILLLQQIDHRKNPTHHLASELHLLGDNLLRWWKPIQLGLIASDSLAGVSSLQMVLIGQKIKPAIGEAITLLSSTRAETFAVNKVTIQHGNIVVSLSGALNDDVPLKTAWSTIKQGILWRKVEWKYDHKKMWARYGERDQFENWVDGLQIFKCYTMTHKASVMCEWQWQLAKSYTWHWRFPC